MHKIFIILFGMFPALTGATVAMLISKPNDRLTAILVLPLWILGTILSQLLGLHLETKEYWKREVRIIVATRIGGLILGVLVFCMMLVLIETDGK